MLLSIDDLIDPDFRSYTSLLNLNSAFTDKNNAFVIISPHRSDVMIDKKSLCSVKAWVQRQVLERHDINKILSSFGVRLAQPDGNSVTFPPLLNIHCETPEDPETETIRQSLLEIRRSPWGKTLASRTANDIGINFYLSDSLDSRGESHFDTRTVQSLMESLKKEVLDANPGIHATWGGMAVYQYYLREGYEKTSLLNIGMMLLILVVFWLLYGNFRSGSLFLATVLLSTIIVYGGLAITGCPIDVLSNTLGLMLVISSLEDFLFITDLQQVAAANSTQTQRSWRKGFRQLVLPCFFTSLTTTIGFGSLCVGGLGIIRRFGAWAALAALIEWAMVFLVFPAFLEVFPKYRSWTKPAPTALFSKIQKISRWKLARPLAFLSLGVYLIGIPGAWQLHIKDTPAKAFKKDHPLNEGLEFMMGSRGWQSEISLVFPNYSDRARNEKIVQAFSKSPLIETIEDPYTSGDYLVSRLSDSRADLMKDLWTRSASGERLVSVDSQARAILYVRDTNITAINELVDESHKICPAGECHLAGTLVSYGEFGDRVLQTLLQSLGLSLLLVSAVIFCLALSLRQKGTIWLLLSAMWGPIALLCVFYLFHIPVFYVTSMFASILVGLSGDNAVQFLFAAKQGLSDGISRRASGSTQVSCAMMILSTVFFFAYFAPLQTLGYLLFAGFFLGFVGDLWLLRGLIPESSNHLPER